MYEQCDSTVSRPDDAALDSMTPAEWLERLDSGEITLEALLADEGRKRQLIQYVVDRDIEEHREIYDRLADS